MNNTHPFSQAEVEASARFAGKQIRLHRWLISVTMAHRTLAGRSFFIQQIAFWATVAGLGMAEWASRNLYPAGQIPVDMPVWLGVALLSFLVRVSIFLTIYRISPVKIAKSIALKFLSLLIVAISCGFWIWTLCQFIGSAVTARELVLCVGFIGISIGLTGMWPVARAVVLIHLPVMWGSFSVLLHVRSGVPVELLVLLNASIALMLWVYVFISIRQVGAQLDRSDEIDSANTRLRQANQAISDLQARTQRTLSMRSAFFAGASHDLKQRLHGTKLVIISARAALRGNPATAPALASLGEEIDALERYMGVILDHAKLESLPVEAQLESVDIQAIFQNIDLQFETTVRTRQLQLGVRFTPLKIGSDAAMLHRILSNLVSNALKFTRRKVLLCARKRAGGIVIQVWDQGPGIKAEAFDRIFEAFRQEDTEANFDDHGYGLGLAIVKHLADNLGYKIEVSSKPGRGSCFSVYIPPGFVL